MRNAKDEVRELLENLPDESSLEDIQYHLDVLRRIRNGLDAAARGQTLPHDEVVRRMARWLAP